MDLNQYLKAVIDSDPMPVVVCDMEHVIVYMNPASIKRYAKNGGADLLGSSLLDCHSPKTGEMIKRILAWFGESPENNRVFEGDNPKEDKDVYMVALRDESGKLFGYYEQHIPRTHETDPQFYPLND